MTGAPVCYFSLVRGSFQPRFCQLLLCFYVILSNCLVRKQNHREKEHVIRNKTSRVCVGEGRAGVWRQRERKEEEEKRVRV